MKDNHKKEQIELYKQSKSVGGIYQIKCMDSKKSWIFQTKDLRGAKNRFEFSIMTDFPPELFLKEDWNQFGAASFQFEIMEELKQKDTQTKKEYQDELTLLFEMWKEEKIGANNVE